MGTDALEPNEELNSEDCPIGNTFCISRLDESRSHPFTTEMEVNGKTLTMENRHWGIRLNNFGAIAEV